MDPKVKQYRAQYKVLEQQHSKLRYEYSCLKNELDFMRRSNAALRVSIEKLKKENKEHTDAAVLAYSVTSCRQNIEQIHAMVWRMTRKLKLEREG